MNPEWLMDPSASNAGPLTPAIQRARHLARIARYFLIAIALLGVVGAVVQIITGGGFTLDLTLLVFFLLVRGLREMRNGARVFTLVICGLEITLALSLIQVALLGRAAHLEFAAFGRQYIEPSISHVLVAAILVLAVYAVPFGILLHPGVRRLYRAANRFRRLGLRTRPWEWSRDLTR